MELITGNMTEQFNEIFDMYVNVLPVPEYANKYPHDDEIPENLMYEEVGVSLYYPVVSDIFSTLEELKLYTESCVTRKFAVENYYFMIHGEVFVRNGETIEIKDGVIRDINNRLYTVVYSYPAPKIELTANEINILDYDMNNYIVYECENEYALYTVTVVRDNDAWELIVLLQQTNKIASSF